MAPIVKRPPKPVSSIQRTLSPELTDAELIELLSEGIETDSDLRRAIGRVTIYALTTNMPPARIDTVTKLLILNHQSIQASKPPQSKTNPILAALGAALDGGQVGVEAAIRVTASGEPAPRKSAPPPWTKAREIVESNNAQADNEPIPGIPVIEEDDF